MTDLTPAPEPEPEPGPEITAATFPEAGVERITFGFAVPPAVLLDLVDRSAVERFRTGASPLVAEGAVLAHGDGSALDLRFVQRSTWPTVAFVLGELLPGVPGLRLLGVDDASVLILGAAPREKKRCVTCKRMHNPAKTPCPT